MSLFSAGRMSMTNTDIEKNTSGSAPPAGGLRTAPPVTQEKQLKANGSRAVIVDDRRLHQRVNLPLPGRFMRETKEEYPCEVINMSPGGIAVRTPAICGLGERVVIYLDTMGRIEGELVRANEDGFALHLIASSYKREKIANQLTWLVNRNQLNMIEDRRHNRFVPKRTNAKLSLLGGETLECQILDISLGGSAVMVEPRPDVGELVTLGLTPGRVVRQFEQGISIQFIEIQDPASLERQFG